MVCSGTLPQNPLCTVGRRGHDDEASEADQEDEVEHQGQVVNVATKAVPLVTNQGHAKGVAKKIL